MDDRTNNDALCENVAREVVKGLADATRNGSRYGTVHVFRSAQELRHEVEIGRRDMLPLPDDVMTPDGDRWLGSFTFEPQELGIGRMGGGMTAAHWVDVLSHESRFLYWVERKARNRQKLPAEYGSMYYFVAVQNDEIELPPDAVLSALTGSRSFTSVPEKERARWRRDHPVAHPEAVKEAADRGWRPVLEEWDYGDDSKYRMTDYGAYLDSAANWAHNLSGVWVMHRTRSLVQWLPNPFAAPEINDPRLLELGFPIAKSGAPMDAD